MNASKYLSLYSKTRAELSPQILLLNTNAFKRLYILQCFGSFFVNFTASLFLHYYIT